PLKLRPTVVFSDGQPFTAEDVLFSFADVYADKTGSPLKEALQVGRKNLQVASPDPGTIVVTFPSPFGPGLRALDNLPILPRHKLGAALEAGTFRGAWGLTTPPAEMPGLGPFVLTSFAPAQRLVL